MLLLRGDAGQLGTGYEVNLQPRLSGRSFAFGPQPQAIQQGEYLLYRLHHHP